MTAVETEPDGKSTKRRSIPWRPIAAGVLGTLALIGIVASTVAVWAPGTRFDRDRVAQIASQSLDDPEVTAALAARITEDVFTAIDVESFLEENLPDRLSNLAPVIAGGAKTAIEDRLSTALQTDEARDLFEGLVRRAHARLMRLLEGGG